MIVTDATRLHRLMNCNGSRLLTPPDLPDNQDETIRDEGNAFHWLAQNPSATVGTAAYNGVFVTAAMMDHVEQYRAGLLPGDMEIDTSHGGEAYQVNGRADHVGYDPDSATLEITDAKYGYRIVEPQDNWTLVSHAVGHCIQTGLAPRQVKLTIFQPRAYHPLGSLRTWSFGYDSLLGFHAMIRDTLTNPSDLLETGEHCHKCPAMSVCPAYRAASMNAIDATAHAFNDTLSAAQLADELNLLELAESTIVARRKAVEELTLHKVKGGEIVPGRMIDRPLGQTRYRKNATPDMLVALVGRDLAERKLPAVSKLRDAGVAQIIIEAMTERAEGAPRLVKVDTDALVRKLGVNTNGN